MIQIKHCGKAAVPWSIGFSTKQLLTLTLSAILFHSFEFMYNFSYENFKKLPGFTLILPVIFTNEDCLPIRNNLDRKVVTEGEKNLLFFVLIL